MEKSDFSEELKKFGKRLKQIRQHRKLTLLELETLSGINDSDLSRYEQGKENLEFFTIFKLARSLDVEVYELVNYDGSLPDNNDFLGMQKRKVTATKILSSYKKKAKK